MIVKSESGQLYNIYNANISVIIPNPQLYNKEGSFVKIFGGANSDETPFALEKETDIFGFGPIYYELTFSNKLEPTHELVSKPFYISNIKFVVVSFGNGLVEATGIMS